MQEQHPPQSQGQQQRPSLAKIAAVNAVPKEGDIDLTPLSLVEEPHVQVLAAKLKDCILNPPR